MTTYNSGKLFLIAFIVLFINAFNSLSAQNITYYKDFNQDKNLVSVKLLDFTPYTETINDGLNDVYYWFKIDNLNTEEYYIQITNPHITEVEAFQDNEKLKLLNRERFITFKTNSSKPIYVKVEAIRESFIPIEINSASVFHFKEKKQLIILGLYYGFAIVILLLNLFYFFNFKDYTFLYYFFFLLTITFGFLISDGLLKLFGIPFKTIDVLETIDHFLVSVTAILFGTSFLQIENYYPKHKYIGLCLMVIIGVLSICYVSKLNFIYYVFFEIFVFSMFILYVTSAGFLFNKNDFSKIFLLAYFFILILGICYFVTKLLGFTILEISANHLKIGGVIEMLVLSFAVVYRMKALKVENNSIRIAIDFYIKEIETLSATVDKQANGDTQKHCTDALSFRENEILQLISQGKTNKEIALDLHISENTVKYHIKNIYTKLNIKSRKEVSAVINN